MDSIHDLGGRQGFGPVEREEDEPAFHARWEAAVYTMTNAAMREGIIRNVDQFRHGVERIDPVAYLTHGYYGRWLGGLETLLSEAGALDAERLDAEVLARGGDPRVGQAARPSPTPDTVPPPSAPGAARALAAEPVFAPGDRVRTRSEPSSGHTRLPAYARGRLGTVVAHQGSWVLPDSNAHGRGEAPEHLYSVRFDGAELWGAEAEPGQAVHIDLFESYLSSVP
ncbi:MAG: nitrile hydratase subunit beta [Pseudomonadota bacterium]